MKDADIRWVQRLNNFRRAFAQLSEACSLAEQRPLSALEQQGLIQAFEFTHELAWGVLKDYFTYQGNNSITGSRDATRQAFAVGLIEDGDAWMEMIRSRNLTSHAYNRETAEEIVGRIVECYVERFEAFLAKMSRLAEST